MDKEMGKEMDKELLVELFRNPAQSGQEILVQEFIKKHLDKYSIDYNIDEEGNIYNTSIDNAPLLCAHMDTVQDDTDILLTDFIKIRGKNILSGYGVIGADDKCGIFIILELLKERIFNFLFCVEEEIGGNGSRYFINNNNIRHIPYGLVLDRNGSGDIICANNGYGIKDFEFVLEEVGTLFGYKPASGTYSDADQLNEQISCANLSVGYYNAHTKSEFVIINDLSNAISYVHAIIKNVTDSFKAPLDYFRRKKWYDFSSDSEYEDYSSFTYNANKCEKCKTFFSKKIIKLKTINMDICSECLAELEEEIYNYRNDIITVDDEIEELKNIDDIQGVNEL